MKRKGLHTGPILFAMLLTLALPALAGIEDGPVPFGASAAAPIKGALYSAGTVTYGQIFQAIVPGPTMDATETSACDGVSCDNTCIGQLSNPYCFVSSATCIETGGGGTACNCITFCAVAGGRQHTPREVWAYPNMTPIETNDGSGE